MKPDAEHFAEFFSRERLDRLFPAERTDRFFDALLGDPEEGAYDIRLAFEGYREGRLYFELELHQRPRKCLTCSLTYGLPKVFARHPVIDTQGLVEQISALLDGRARCKSWRLGATREKSRRLHVVPLLVELEEVGG